MITKFLIFNLQQNCRCIQWPGFSIVLWIQCKVLYVSLQWLSLISGTKLLEINKHSTWIDALDKKRDMDRRAIGVSCILDAAFLYLPFFVTVLRYLLPPNIPLMQKVKLNCGRKWYKDVKSTRQDVIKSKNQTCPFSHCYASGSPSFDRGVECLLFLC